MIFQTERTAPDCLFRFSKDEWIEHKSGKVWHPKGGSTNPGDNTICVLHSDRHDGAKFYFGDSSGAPLNSMSTK